MPVFYQQQINDTTRLGIWKIEESEEFFKRNVPGHREVTHPHKRLQHLAGRFLLQFLFPDFPHELIKIADTRKPFLPGDEYHFSISHCGDYAAAIVSKNIRVGIDIEKPVDKVAGIIHKFLSAKEQQVFRLGSFSDENSLENNFELPTILWSAKEAVFKWYGHGGVDFRKEIQLQDQDQVLEIIHCFFLKNQNNLCVHYRKFNQLVLAWVEG